MPVRRFLDRTTPPTTFTLVVISGVGALSMNIFLPSLPAMAESLNADYAVIQLAVSAYLAVTGALQLLLGPLADRFGRRPVLLCAFAVFAAASAGAALAQDVETFLAFRMLQAAVASGIALSRAIVRDMVAPEKAAAMIGAVTMGMALAPMVSPMVGGALEAVSGWRASFALMCALGVATAALVWADLGETAPKDGGGFRQQVAAWPEVLGSTRFWGWTATAMCASGAFFAFLGGGPFVAREILGLGAAESGFWFGFIALGYMTGNGLSARYAERAGLHRMVTIGSLTATAGMGCSLVAFGLGAEHPLALFLPALGVGVGNGMTMPSCTSGALSVRPHVSGAAAGLNSAMLIGGGAVISAVTGALLGPETGPWPLIWMMFAASAGSVVAARWVVRVDRRRRAEAAALGRAPG